MRNLLGVVLAGLLLLVSGPASSAPVARSADLNLSLTIQGLAPVNITTLGSSVTVDDAAGTIQVAPGALTLATPLVIPVTSTTAIASVTATVISNQGGTFSMGGAGGATAVGCPPGAAGSVCINGGGLGGVMGLTGVLNVIGFLPFLVFPISLDAAGFGQGGQTTAGLFFFAAAPWTTGTGAISVPVTSPVTTTTLVPLSGGFSTVASTITLVSPTYVSALGFNLPALSAFTISFTDGLGMPSFMVPEPGTFLLLGSGVLGLAFFGRRRRGD